ncbi:ATPase [Striga asiatica]|uniref:ATPase n=1 Tax=Striga asiatica TaxID=4170 RepID=A0A5A7QUQ6_STRAF|nr:ATPase [Striga asiatica]
MKLFSEFMSCWGGAAVTPAEDSAGGRRNAEEAAEFCRDHGRAAACRRAHNWKPKLNAISEDRPIAVADGTGVNPREGGGVVGKRSVKVKPKSAAAKAAPLRIHDGDYWKSAQMMAVPAFAPTSFSF